MTKDELAARKLVELREKLAGVDAEFERWLADAGETKPLRKHQSQILHVTRQLGCMVNGLRDSLQELERDDGLVLAQCRGVQIRVLEVHRLWDYFRSKLTLRYVDWFRDYLAVADELANACYAPARDAFTGAAAPRTVPLVFFSGEFSPYTHARDKAFAVEAVPDAMDSRELREFAGRLPIPVIGVPWYQVSHLPDALMIAHEVGHDVEDDFGLSEPMEAALEPVLDTFGSDAGFAWGNWRRELFADLYGLLAIGPAYAMSLADLLATDPKSLAQETGDVAAFDPHPPATLRLAAMSWAIDRLGLEVEPAASRQAWERTFAAPPGDTYHEQLGQVVDALLDVTYDDAFGGRTLEQVLPFPNGYHADCVTVKNAALLGVKVTSDDIRVLVAGARLAFEENAGRYVQRQDANGRLSPQDRILRRALENIDDKPRHAGGSEPTEAEDLDAGAALLEALQARTRRSST